MSGGRDTTGPQAGRGEASPMRATADRNSDHASTPGLATRRIERRPRRRATVFLPAAATIGATLTAVPDTAARVYMLGPKPGLTAGGLLAWVTGELPAGWSHAPAGHYLEGDHPALRFLAPGDRPVELLRAASYFGDGAYTVDQARDAWELLADGLTRVWPGAVPLSTPATLGRDLLLRSIPHGREWPVLPDGLQTLIRSTSGQGRIQLVPRDTPTIPGLYGYDGRLMYAALCRNLAGGRAQLMRVGEYQGRVRARYRATATVPRDWEKRCACNAPGHRGIGLLGVPAADRGDGWEYPAEPGRNLSGWWDGAEIAVALDHGWHVRMHEAIVWPDYRGAGPLDGWARRLVELRGVFQRVAGYIDGAPGRYAHGPDTRRAYGLAATAVRAIMLHAIGALYGAPQAVTRIAPIDGPPGAVPRGAENLRVEAGHYVWAQRRTAPWRELSHPELSAAIWARARARLLSGPGVDRARTGALHVPAGDVLAFRTDALYTTAPTGWSDDGATGRLRLVTRIDHELPTPRTAAELLGARRG